MLNDTNIRLGIYVQLWTGKNPWGGKPEVRDALFILEEFATENKFNLSPADYFLFKHIFSQLKDLIISSGSSSKCLFIQDTLLWKIPCADDSAS